MSKSLDELLKKLQEKSADLDAKQEEGEEQAATDPGVTDEEQAAPGLLLLDEDDLEDDEDTAADEDEWVDEDEAFDEQAAPDPLEALREVGDMAKGCLIIGPSNAGKTSLIAALTRASSIPSAPHEPRLQLRPVGDSEPLERLMADWFRSITAGGEGIQATAYNALYELDGELMEQRGSNTLIHQARFKLHDGPGGALFPRNDEEGTSADMLEFAEKLAEAGRSAHTLVICVEANPPHHEANARLEHTLKAALSRLTTRYSEPVMPVREATLWKRLSATMRRMPLVLHDEDHPVARRTTRRLNARRVLILFNKIDRLCARAAPQDSSATPAQIARGLDPLGTALDLIGAPLLQHVIHHLRPDARLAVGMCSATGFDSHFGLPFVSPDGSHIHNPSGLPPASLMQMCEPFGVREALQFIISGQARGPIELVDHDALSQTAVDAHQRFAFPLSSLSRQS